MWSIAAFLLTQSAAGATPVPTPIGAGPRFHPRPTSAAVARMEPIGRFRCETRVRPTQRAHVELFARGRVVVVPAGIGIAPPLVRVDAAVRRGRCTYPIRTSDPTGVVEFAPSFHPTLGDLFRIWGRPFSESRLLGFRGSRVRIYVAGRRRRGPVRSVPLRRRSEIVVEIGPFVAPHTAFLFRPGQ
jgi:hypothetical protein